jgi:hypothetical protein
MEFFCEICKITCYGENNYQEHLKGKKHLNNANGGSKIRCDICDIYCSGESNYRDHLAGKKHKKNVKEDVKCKQCQELMNIVMQFENHYLKYITGTGTGNKKNEVKQKKN